MVTYLFNEKLFVNINYVISTANEILFNAKFSNLIIVRAILGTVFFFFLIQLTFAFISILNVTTIDTV